MCKIDVQQIQVQVSQAERDTFLAGNKKSVVTQTEAFLWMAFENAQGSWVCLYSDELPVAAEMARRAGMDSLADRLLSV